MPTIAELGVDLYDALGYNYVRLRDSEKQEATRQFLEAQRPLFVATKIGEDRAERHGRYWPRDIYNTPNKGLWRVTVIDPEGRLSTPHNSWRTISQMSSRLKDLEIAASQPAHPTKNPDESEERFQERLRPYQATQTHTDVQLFFWSNWDLISRQRFPDHRASVVAPLPCHLEVSIYEPPKTRTPDLIGFVPDTRPHIMEIGTNFQRKLEVTEDYVELFTRSFGMPKDQVLWSIVQYSRNGSLYDIDVYTADVASSQLLAESELLSA